MRMDNRSTPSKGRFDFCAWARPVFLSRWLTAWVLAAVPAYASANDDGIAYPTRTVTLVVGFAPGGATDLTARLLAGKLSQAFGKPFVVENRPGANSNIATEHVVRAKPDGHTLLVETIANATNMTAYRNIRHDAARDLSPIVLVMSSPAILVVTPGLAVTDLQSLIKQAKSPPGRLTFASSGTGGATHLAFELLKIRTAVELVHVPYSGAAPAMAAIMAGQVSTGFLTSLGALAAIQGGQLRPIAVAHSRRLPGLPDVPTMSESGIDDFDVSSWNGLAAPVGTPQAIITRLNHEVNRILSQPDVQQQLQLLGGIAVGGSPAQFGDHVRAQILKWRQLIQAARVTLD